jgi:Putative amidoligase enzyme
VGTGIPGKDGLKAIKTALKVLADLGCKVNKTCSVHIHHDARDLDLAAWKHIMVTYLTHEAQIDSYHAESRRANNAYYARSLDGNYGHYSHNTVAGMVARINDCRRSDTLRSISFYGTRYMKVNTQSYVKHGTLEFRQHGGSLNGDKVTAWIQLTQLMMVAAKAHRAPAADLMTAVNAKAKLSRYYTARATELAA